MAMAAEYEDFLTRIQLDRSRLEEYNLGRMTDSFNNLSASLSVVVDELRSFR